MPGCWRSRTPPVGALIGLFMHVVRLRPSGSAQVRAFAPLHVAGRQHTTGPAASWTPRVTVYVTQDDTFACTAHDGDLLIELDRDPAVVRYLPGGGEPTTPDEVRQRDLPSILSGYEKWESKLGLFATHVKEHRDVNGWFHRRLEPGAPQDKIELGYRLRQAEWGMVMPVLAGGLWVDEGFANLDVRLVWAADDDRQRRVAEGAGEDRGDTRGPHPDAAKYRLLRVSPARVGGPRRVTGIHAPVGRLRRCGQDGVGQNPPDMPGPMKV